MTARVKLLIRDRSRPARSRRKLPSYATAAIDSSAAVTSGVFMTGSIDD